MGDKLVTAHGQFMEPRIVTRRGGREGPGDNTDDEQKIVFLEKPSEPFPTSLYTC